MRIRQTSIYISRDDAISASVHRHFQLPRERPIFKKFQGKTCTNTSSFQLLVPSWTSTWTYSQMCVGYISTCKSWISASLKIAIAILAQQQFLHSVSRDEGWRTRRIEVLRRRVEVLRRRIDPDRRKKDKNNRGPEENNRGLDQTNRGPKEQKKYIYTKNLFKYFRLYYFNMEIFKKMIIQH